MKLAMRLTLIGVPLLALAGFFAKSRANFAALAASGFREKSGESVQEFFANCIQRGSLPTQISKCMPKGASLDRFVAPTSDGDSLLLERYTYHAWGIGSWPVQIYYERGGGVNDFYAQDEWPSLYGARPVSGVEADQWRLASKAP
jgi:hypothetical protein